jgi:hypothetical protein
LIANAAGLSIVSDEYKPLLIRVVYLLTEFHKLRYSGARGGKGFSRRLVAQSMPADRNMLAQYVQSRLDEEKNKAEEYLEGRKRLYELVEVRVEDEFNEELEKEIETASEEIAMSLLKKYLSETIEELSA